MDVAAGVDAVTYLALDQVFAANTTGNVLFIGFALGGTTDVGLLDTALALAAFSVGAVLGVRRAQLRDVTRAAPGAAA